MSLVLPAARQARSLDAGGQRRQLFIRRCELEIEARREKEGTEGGKVF